MLFISVLISCSSNKENFKLINDLLKEDNISTSFYGIKNKSNLKVIDTILLSSKSNSINEISQYSLDWDALNSRNSFYNGVKIIWIDSIQKISLSQSEMSYLRSQMTNEVISFSQKNIHSKNVIIIDKDSIRYDNYKYSYAKKKKVFIIYNFTKPIFNKTKSFALIGFYSSTNLSLYDGGFKNCMMVLKKINNTWQIIGYEKDVGLSD